jgi:uncharacterized protein with von Willebrand factor type A (vWA) domain
LFDAYFLPPNARSMVESHASGGGRLNRSGAGQNDASEGQAVSREGCGEGAMDQGAAAKGGASREASLIQADFRHLNASEDIRDIEALMRQFARRLRALELRRERTHANGRWLDVRATLRRSVSTGGLPVRLVWRDRHRVRPRLVLLLDVSRSMSLYSFFYLRLARALGGLLGDLHVFLYHTQLTGVSEALRDPDPWRSQERLQLLSAGWAGGTRIGECLQEFNRLHAARLVHSRTAVIVMSDGYDTGEPSLLTHELTRLKRRARRIVWLNPLASRPGYTPTSLGMQAALPHLDLLAPGADLASIERALPSILRSLH